MKFPLPLSLDLFRSRIARAFAGAGSETIVHLSPAAFPPEGDGDGALPPARNKAPVVWLGGQEPLAHPAIGRIALALTALRRNVFVHTDGLRLRPRIHEFCPDDRLFLTVEFAGREKAHEIRTGEAGSFRRIIEGIRSAKLSGFHVCAHLTVDDETELCETGELIEYLDGHDVDGFIVSSGGRGGALSPAVREKLAEARSLVRSPGWERFSRLLEASYKAPAAGTVAAAGAEAGESA